MYVTAIPVSFSLILETSLKYIFLSLLHGWSYKGDEITYIYSEGKFLVHQAISSNAKVFCKSTIEHLFFQQEITEITFVSVEFLIYTII